MKNQDLLLDCTGFECDEDNSRKNRLKHYVTSSECEQVFFNQPLATGADEKHSTGEKRYYALGQTDAGRLMFIVFTVRNKLIRVISARDMSRKERKTYLAS